MRCTSRSAVGIVRSGAVVLALVLLTGPGALAEQPFVIQPGDSVSGSILSVDVHHCVHISLPRHAVLKAILRRDAGEDLAVRLGMRGPNAAAYNIEEWLTAKSDGRKVVLAGFEVPESGVWRCVVSTGDFRGGRYTLKTRVSYAEKFKQTGLVTAEAQEASFAFAGPAGARVKVKLKGKGGLLPRILEMLGPDGLPVAIPEPSGTGRKVKLTDVLLPATGDYTLIVASRDDTRGEVTSKISVDAPGAAKIAREFDGPLDCCDDSTEPPPDTEQYTVSTALVTPSDQTVPVGTTRVHALTMSFFSALPTSIEWFRLRSHGRDEDMPAVRIYWDNDRFYTDDDPGDQIAGGYTTFVSGALDVAVNIAVPPFTVRYLHVVVDLAPGLPVGREFGVRIPSGGVDIEFGTWNPASRPPHDPGPIRIISPEVTYAWQNSTQIAGSGAPAGEGHLVVRADRKMILFPANETPFRNYYELDLDFLGAGWRQVSPTGGLPPKRWGACGVYDPTGERLIMFGGQNGAGTEPYLADVWELDLGQSPPAWTNITPTGGGAPSARILASAVLDTNRRRMVVFGGHDASSAVKADVWAFDLATESWSGPLSVSGSIPWAGQGLTGHAAVYDPVHDRMVVTGGSPIAAKANEFTSMSNRSYFLEFADAPDTNVWRNIVTLVGDAATGRMQAAVAYDGARMIVHGGARTRLAASGLTDFLEDTWVLDLKDATPGKWVKLHFTAPGVPDARAGHHAVWDPVLRSVILYGGLEDDGALKETWLLNESDK